MVVEKSAEYYLVFSGYYYDETYHIAVCRNEYVRI